MSHLRYGDVLCGSLAATNYEHLKRNQDRTQTLNEMLTLRTPRNGTDNKFRALSNMVGQ